MISDKAKLIRASLTREVLDSTSVEQKRTEWEAASKAIPTPSGVSVSAVDIGGVLCLVCSTDKAQTDKAHAGKALSGKIALSKRVIVYCHGGGLVEGSAETFRVWGARVALRTGCRVVLVDYRLAPENPYPAAINDVFSVCRAVPSVLDSAEQIVIGADSTGSVLGLASMVKFKQSQDVNIVGGFFLSPSIDFTFSGNSIAANEDNDRIVSLSVLKQYANYYCDSSHFNNSAVSPLFADLSCLPPILVMADDSELLLDDAIRLHRIIKNKGGTCLLNVNQGLWHVWPLWGEFAEAATALDDIAEHIFNLE